VTDFADAYQSLLRFLYRAPIAVVQTTLDGVVELMTPRAAQLLLPLARNGNVDNLFCLLEPAAPNLRALVAAFAPPDGVVCEGLRAHVPAGVEGPEQQILTISLLKLGGRELMAVLADVTREVQRVELERRVAGHKLSELTASLEQALSTLAILLAREDLATGRIFLNERLRELLGMPEAADGRTMAELMRYVHPADRATFQEDRDDAIAGLQAAFRDFRLLCPDGSVAWMTGRRFLERDVDGVPVRLTTFGVDVSEQRAVERERLALAEHLKLSTEAAGIGTFEVDVHTREMVWNAQTYALFGRATDAGGDTRPILEQALAPGERARLEDWLESVFSGQSSSTIEFPVTWPDAQVRQLAKRGQVRRDQNGTIVSMIGVTWDVTEQHHAAAALQAQRVAEHASRAKSEFLSRVSHELRTPLNAMLGFAQILRMRGAAVSADERDQHVGQIEKAGWHLLELIKELLDLSRIEAGTMLVSREPVPLQRLCAECIELLQPLARAAGITVIDRTVDVEPLAALGDNTRLNQVLMNLLSNAVKYNRQGGSVTLTLNAVDSDWVEIGVADTGRGFTAEQLRDLYQPFNRLGADQAEIDGTGIGLVISKRLTEMMGGQLELDTREGAGALFTLRLPRAQPVEEEQGPPQHVPAPPADTPRVKRTVLYIEDNPSNVDLVESVLSERSDIELLVAPDGPTGLNLANNRRPDLILIDIGLPGIDGYEVCRRLRARMDLKATPILALSANATQADIERGHAAGFDDYLTKPLDVKLFLSHVDRLLEAATP